VASGAVNAFYAGSAQVGPRSPDIEDFGILCSKRFNDTWQIQVRSATLINRGKEAEDVLHSRLSDLQVEVTGYTKFRTPSTNPAKDFDS